MCREPQETWATHKRSHLQGNQHHRRHQTAEPIHFFAIEIPHLPMLQLPLKLQSLKSQAIPPPPCCGPNTHSHLHSCGQFPRAYNPSKTEGFLYEPLSSGLALLSTRVTLDPSRSSLISHSYYHPCALPALPYPSSLSWLNAQTAHFMNESPTLFYNSGFP